MKNAQKKYSASLTYVNACKLMAKMDYWTAEDAAALLLGAIPSKMSSQKLPSAKADKVAQLAHIISGADSVINPESPIGRFRVPPAEIIEWAEKKWNGQGVPQELKNAVLGATEDLQKQEAFIKQSTFHRERCRAVAALLWKQDETKHLTLETMAKHPELLQIGCKGTSYKHDTIKEWIKEQNPNRGPGRRPKRLK